MPIGTDKRLFERIDGKLAVRYSPYGSNKEYCTTTKNISGGGIRATLLKKLPPGTLLDIEIFKYDTGLEARCRGEVVWVWDASSNEKDEQGFESGIRFLGTRTIPIGRLISYLRSQQRQESL